MHIHNITVELDGEQIGVSLSSAGYIEITDNDDCSVSLPASEWNDICNVVDMLGPAK